MEQKQPPKTAAPAQPKLSPLGNVILAGAALGLSYAAVSAAIDTGSLLEYTAALILFVLGVRNLVRAYQGRKKQ